MTTATDEKEWAQLQHHEETEYCDTLARLSVDPNLHENFEMMDKEFRIWIARKPNETQEKVENQHKETRKTIQEMKDQIDVFFKKQ